MLLFVLVCGGGAVAVWQGVFTPPPLHLSVGSYDLRAEVTARPECPPAASCPAPDPAAPPNRAFVVWLFKQEDPTTISGRQIFKLPIKP